MSAESRFWAKVRKEPGDGCWLWLGSLVRGYGDFWPEAQRKAPRRAKAHRFSWILANGPIPDGLQVCHHCDTPACVRPDHLFLGTVSDNLKDCVAKGRHRYYVAPPKVACPQGHLYEPGNLVRRSDGSRRCRRCNRERLRASKRRAAELNPPRPYRKLTDNTVLAIRERVAAGEPQRSVAMDYGICQTRVSQIVRRKAWAHVA